MLGFCLPIICFCLGNALLLPRHFDTVRLLFYIIQLLSARRRTSHTVISPPFGQIRLDTARSSRYTRYFQLRTSPCQQNDVEHGPSGERIYSS